MKKFGLIGFPLSHSFSKRYFTTKFENEKIDGHSYELFSLENIKDFPKLLDEHEGLCGINVTVPHKKNIMPYLDWISHDAKEVGAVNCIRVTSESPVQAAFDGELGVKGHNFKLEGYNTDIYGFEESLKPLLTNAHTKALILGNGGAACAVKYVLGQLDIEYQIVTRRAEEGCILFGQLTPEMVAGHKLIVNTTPVGTSPNVDECPHIPYEGITPEHLLYDLIYNPAQTLFLTKGIEQGCMTKNGYQMLELQAERSWEIWTSKTKHP
ncbi:shikimate dehydrogenase [Mucilaginibacter sp. HMF5004]|uniref:shikimate dehydrogenase family protein n=1 Tax=Mucilaginibacter rivuli TaxID=2857527 RepID=UPI001C5E164F|nr:shikimate dehydrogenase [Mucilaginibacter rivuli]MBW4888586.1 shikimate dehydrogenase [Mucilaginibacter rivuli]